MALTKSKKDNYPSYQEFFESVKNKNFAPFYLFIGQEDFLIDECVNKIIKELLSEDTKSFNLDVVYGSKIDAKSVIAHASSFPMANDKRVVVVKEFEKLVNGESSKAIISSYINNPMPSTCFIMITEKPDFRTKPYSDIKKTGAVFAFNNLYDNQVPTWILNRCKRIGISTDIEACKLLQAYVGNSLRSIHNELEKLSIYIGDRKNLTVDDVADAVGASRGFTVFDLQNAIGKKNFKEAISILRRMLEFGEAPQLTIIMLTRYFNILWKIKSLISLGKSEQEIISATKISPYFLKDYLAAEKLYSISQIENAFLLLLKADVELKSTSPDPYNLMEMLVYSLISSNKTVEVEVE